MKRLLLSRKNGTLFNRCCSAPGQITTRVAPQLAHVQRASEVRRRCHLVEHGERTAYIARRTSFCSVNGSVPMICSSLNGRSLAQISS